MSTSPLCSEMVDFYKPLRKIRYKISLIRATPHESCIFSGQNACGCRHSAVICSISIPSPVKYGTKLASSFESMLFCGSKWMWMSPFCGGLAIFYRVARPARQKIALSAATAQNLCIFTGQSGCGCRHSAAVLPFSIGWPALRDKK